MIKEAKEEVIGEIKQSSKESNAKHAKKSLAFAEENDVMTFDKDDKDTIPRYSEGDFETVEQINAKYDVGENDNFEDNIIDTDLLPFATNRAASDTFGALDKELGEMRSYIEEGVPKRMVSDPTGYLSNALQMQQEELFQEQEELLQRIADEGEEINNREAEDLSTAIELPIDDSNFASLFQEGGEIDQELMQQELIRCQGKSGSNHLYYGFY